MNVPVTELSSAEIFNKSNPDVQEETEELELSFLESLSLFTGSESTKKNYFLCSNDNPKFAQLFFEGR